MSEFNVLSNDEVHTSGCEQKIGEMLCEVTASHAREQKAIAEQVSPAISPPISPSTDENYKTESDGNKCGNQSGTGNEKPSCYKCKYRRELVGDCHSSCVHPGALPIAILLFAAGQTEMETKQIHVRGNTHGVRSGWFMWPMNFDPVWLEICSGFEQSTERRKELTV